MKTTIERSTPPPPSFEKFELHIKIESLEDAICLLACLNCSTTTINSNLSSFTTEIREHKIEEIKWKDCGEKLENEIKRQMNLKP